ncbi:hypothetical protein [Chamaesiphon sp.]
MRSANCNGHPAAILRCQSIDWIFFSINLIDLGLAVAKKLKLDRFGVSQA